MRTLFPRNIWLAILLLVSGFTVSSLVCIPLVFIGDDTNTDVKATIHLIVLLITWCLFYLINRRNGHRVAYSFSGGWTSPVLLLAAPLVVTFQVGVNQPLTYYIGHAFGLINEGGESHLPFFSLILVGSIFEELVFRGAILHSFLQNMGRIRAVLLSSLLFAVIHILPHMLLGAFALGALFGIVYVHTRNLAHTMALHVLANSVGMLTGRICGQAAPHNSLHIFLPALAATVAITVVLVKHLRRKQLTTNNITAKTNTANDKGACPLA